MELRTCLRDPVPEIFAAARMLDAAVEAHLRGNRGLAVSMLIQSNMPAIRAWTESLWGANSPYAPRQREGEPEAAPVPSGTARMPNAATKRALHARDGYHCRFCGIPVIRAEVRKRLVQLYPELSLWGKKNLQQHAALQAMWVHYDHIVPFSRGGTNDLSNLVVTCAPCNCCRMEYTLEESRLANPLLRTPKAHSWDGLERLLTADSGADTRRAA